MLGQILFGGMGERDGVGKNWDSGLNHFHTVLGLELELDPGQANHKPRSSRANVDGGWRKWCHGDRIRAASHSCPLSAEPLGVCDAVAL